MILPVMKPCTMEWPLKSGFTAYVMFKTLSNMLTAYWFITTFSTLIYNVHMNYFNFSKSKRDDNDDLIRYDIWF